MYTESQFPKTPSSARSGIKKLQTSSFHAAPPELGHLKSAFDKHDAPNGAHLNHSRIAQQNQIDLCFWDARAPSCDCGSLPKSFVGKLLTTIGKLPALQNSYCAPSAGRSRSRLQTFHDCSLSFRWSFLEWLFAALWRCAA